MDEEDSEDPGLDSHLVAARRTLIESAKKMAQAEVESVVQSEVLTKLIDGNRTLAELVEEIYGIDRENPEYQRYYARVRRAVKNLSSKGLVSEGILRKDTPYRLTRYGAAKLTRIGQPAGEYDLVSRTDIAMFSASIFLLFLIAISRTGLVAIGPDSLKVIFTVFFVLGGASMLRLLQIIRNVV